MERVIVLRDMRRRRQFNDPFGPAMRQHGDRSASLDLPPELRIEVEETDREGRRELLRDQTTVAVATAMPMSLVTPRQADGGTTWGIKAIGADKSDCTGEGVVVAVLDTGIDRDHPAFAGVELSEKDFSGSGNGDLQGHGTHCAGTIFGRDVEGQRIGVARGVTRALIGKVLNDSGGGTSDMLYQGIEWAAASGAHVISMSLGFDFAGQVEHLVRNQGLPMNVATSQTLVLYRGNVRLFDRLIALIAAREAFEHGVVVVAAAGNESDRNKGPDHVVAAGLPAAADGVIAVGAVGRAGRKLAIGDFSNSYPNLCAPGVDVLSANAGGGLTALTGTSMACPHVAGAAALWWERVREDGLPPKANLVAARMRVNARVDMFKANTDMEDRGEGFVIAP